MRTLANVLSWQGSHGLWPKNTDTLNHPAPAGRAVAAGTFDNGASRRELRLLARAFGATGREDCRTAFLRGFDTILRAQYPSGGWPQTYPAGSGYARHITFNDGTMVGLMEFLREVAGDPAYEFVGQQGRRAAAGAFERGIDAILKCQIRSQGRLSVWCAQHDAVTFEPRPARTYELESLSGAESAGVLRLLMSLDEPSAAVRDAVRAGVAWYEQAQLRGIRQIWENGNKVIKADPAAPPLWARFYDLRDMRPFFCGRDGVKRRDLAEIEAERRNGYAWYGEWGAAVLRDYAVWVARHGTPAKQERLGP